MKNDQLPATVTKIKGGNPFQSGFVPTGRRRKNYSQSFLTKKSLLKHMLEVDITVRDLPTKMADDLRTLLPGWFDHVERRFTMRQIMELSQLQLLFSRSDYVRQDAINSIKDRVDGKAVQKLELARAEDDPTEFILPSGRRVQI